MYAATPTYWPSARQFAEAIQCPSLCFSSPYLKDTLPAVDKLGMPLVTSGQFAYVYKLKPSDSQAAFAVRCFRGFLGDRELRYRAIDRHLQERRIPALASFGYDSEGMLVGGRRYPILVMQWIEGPTLDVYLEGMLGRRDVLLHLADEWLKLISSLREAGVAHGDLQHGNIIVERGQLRLVDLDGMYVPGMEGWKASEVGHQHYQHPARNAFWFDRELDNFSALVIYLSLVSLAERPELWREHHDENLILSKGDFKAGGNSEALGKIKEIGAEHRRLAEALERAAEGSAAEVPDLLELVSVKSRLPSWVKAPAGLDFAGRTREVSRSEALPAVEGPAWTPWRPDRRTRPVPSTPGSNAVQSVFSVPTGTQVVRPAIPPLNASASAGQIMAQALRYSRANLRNTRQNRKALAWLPLIIFQLFNITSRTLGLPFVSLLVIACLVVVWVWMPSLFYGFRRALAESRGQPRPGTLSSHVAGLPLTVTPAPRFFAQSPPPAVQPATLPARPVIGNRVLGIYHLPACEWAGRVLPRNRVEFASPAMAQAAGQRPCRVCRP